ncbi:MAG: class I SAM-dependent methyltransferase [Gammaproteobacteria bacterium]|nr:MAG: class I SAM-dependent methyltransferase [Gammaproteobacteria bacterium]
MSNRTIQMTDEVYDYLLDVSLRESPVLAELREVTAKHPMVGMQISPEQGQFMALLVRLIGARRCLEIGVFTGYSSLAVASALPHDGKIIACDVNEEFTAIAKKFWDKAGVAKKIDLRLAPATDTLDQLLRDGRAGGFDFAFIDADKTSYEGYYERCLELLRPGGLMAIDNVLWSGSLVDERNQDPDCNALRSLNRRLYSDERVDLSMVPIGDGLTLARKRP